MPEVRINGKSAEDLSWHFEIPGAGGIEPQPTEILIP
jgi:hypothetical protein